MRMTGALPAETLSELIDAGFIRNGTKANLRPSSLDLTLSSEIYRVEGVFLPRPYERIRDMLHIIGATKHHFDYPLEKNVTYIVKLEENLHLPEGLYGYCNPRSSTGRNDILVRVLADGIGRFDAITESGYAGEMWLVISPQSYPVLMQAGQTLSQLRLFTGNNPFTELELQIALERDKLLWDLASTKPHRYTDLSVTDRDGSILLSAHLHGEIVGWECLGSNKVLDFSLNAGHNPEDFFTPITAQNGQLTLRKNGFYILKTKENVRIPKSLACEMIPTDERTGEFRTHYAGFIDPGWGYGTGGEGVGRSLVMEVRPYQDILIRDGQPMAKIKFEYMTKEPIFGYDELSVSNYSHSFNAPKLSRHFRM